MAHLQHPQIILHNKSRDGSLRWAANQLGIPSITVEVGDPQRFQENLINRSLHGINNILSHLKMLPFEETEKGAPAAVCMKSSWIFTQKGGFLEVFPEVTDRVKKGEMVARLTDAFGQSIQEYKAPADGIVIGKSVNPVTPSGGRILHLGIEKS